MVGQDLLGGLGGLPDVLLRAAQPDAAERAEELYQRITALHNEGYYATAPDVVSFNTVLKAYAYETDPAKAEEAVKAIKRWKFPKPKDAGMVEVNYRVRFKTAGR